MLQQHIIEPRGSSKQLPEAKNSLRPQTSIAQSRGRPSLGPPCLCIRMAWQRGCHIVLLQCDQKQAKPALAMAQLDSPREGEARGAPGKLDQAWQQD